MLMSWNTESCNMGTWGYSEWRVNLWTQNSLRIKIGEWRYGEKSRYLENFLLQRVKTWGLGDIQSGEWRYTQMMSDKLYYRV